MLIEEIDYLKAKGIDAGPDVLMISDRAHVIMPYHKLVDHGREKMKGDKKIGTTGRGIGPCYEDKATRRGVRFVDLIDPESFKERLEAIVPEKNFYLKQFLDTDTVDLESIQRQYTQFADRLATLRHQRVRCASGKPAMPASRSCSKAPRAPTWTLITAPTPLSPPQTPPLAMPVAAAGSGPKDISGVIGIVKAYTTRVGAGPFPSELFDDIGDQIQKTGSEFGATTGRRRRCGWLDTVILNNAVRLNGLTGLAITKLDVLGELDELKICTAYELDGQRINEVPANLNRLAACKPIYETVPGWKKTFVAFDTMMICLRSPGNTWPASRP